MFPSLEHARRSHSLTNCRRPRVQSQTPTQAQTRPEAGSLGEEAMVRVVDPADTSSPACGGHQMTGTGSLRCQRRGNFWEPAAELRRPVAGFTERGRCPAGGPFAILSRAAGLDPLELEFLRLPGHVSLPSPKLALVW